MQETGVWSLGQEDPLEKEVATHSSVLAWENPMDRNLASYSPWGRKESDTTEGTKQQQCGWKEHSQYYSFISLRWGSTMVRTQIYKSLKLS